MSRSQTGSCVRTRYRSTCPLHWSSRSPSLKFLQTCVHGQAACCVLEFADHVPAARNQNQVCEVLEAGRICNLRLRPTQASNRTENFLLVDVRRCCSADLPSQAAWRPFTRLFVEDVFQHEVAILLEMGPKQRQPEGRRIDRNP